MGEGDADKPKIIIAGSGWDPKKIKEVAEKTKVGERALSEPTETKARFSPPGMSVRDLYNTAVFGKEEEERNSAYGELHRRIKTAEEDVSIGFSRQMVKDTLVQTLEESSWDNFYGNLLRRGSNQENECQGVDSYKDGNLGGLMNMIYQMTADVASAQGAIRKLGKDEVDGLTPDQKRWLAEKMGGTDDALELFNRRNSALRAKVLTLIGFSPDVNLAELVGKHPRSEGEEEYQRVKYGDVIEQMAKKLKEAQTEGYQQQAELMGEFLTQLEKAFKGESLDVKPKTKEEQLWDVRKELDDLEAQRIDWQNSQELIGSVLKLEAKCLSKNVDDDIKKEIRTRLAVWDSARLMRRASGFITDNPTRDLTVPDAVVSANLRGHGIGRAETEWVLLADRGKVETKRGARTNVEYGEVKAGETVTLSEATTLAWDLLETINSNRYRDVLIEIGAARPDELYEDPANKGRPKVVNFFQDTKDEACLKRRNIVKGWVLQRLGGGINIQLATDSKRYSEKQLKEMGHKNYVAQKAVEIAENHAVSVLQPSRWNSNVRGGRLFVNDENYGGNDHLAECIHIWNWRKERDEAMRDRGPGDTIKYVPGWGDSWISVGNNTTAVAECTAENMVDDYHRGPDPLLGRFVNTDGTFAGGDGIVAYATTKLVRYWLLKKEMLKAQYEPQDISEDFLRSINVYFTAAESTFSQEKASDPNTNLRWWWVTHTLMNSMSNLNTKWENNAYSDFESAVTTPLSILDRSDFNTEREYNSEVEKSKFITKAQYDSAVRWIHMRGKRFVQELVRQERGMPTILDRILGGGGGARKGR